MTSEELNTLSMQEQQCLRALMDKREAYRAAGHPWAANLAGGLAQAAWRLFKWERRVGLKP